MQWLMFGALSAIAAILFGPVLTWMTAKSDSLTSDTATKFFSSYFGKTAVVAASFFVVLIAAATVMRLVGKKAAIPEVV